MPPVEPKSPNPQFDFMLKGQPQPKPQLIPGLTRPKKIIMGVMAIILLLIIISSVLSGRKAGGTQSLVNTVARGQEILRVTKLAQSQLQLQDPGTKALAATVGATLSSDQQQIASYLAKNNVKISKSQLIADVDKSTDSSLQSAQQNNQLDSAYKTYIKAALAQYQQDLNTAYKPLGPNGKTIVKAAYQSAGAIVNSAPLKT